MNPSGPARTISSTCTTHYHRLGVQIEPFARRETDNPVTVCKSSLLHTARLRTQNPVPRTQYRCAKSSLLHTARLRTQNQNPVPRSGVQIEPFARREFRNPEPRTPNPEPSTPYRCANRAFCTPRGTEPRTPNPEPSTPYRCANRAFYTPRVPKPRTQYPVPVCKSSLLHATSSEIPKPEPRTP